MHHLGYRKLLQLKGNFEEIQLFLQSVITNDARAIVEDSVLYALLLTPQGKIIADLFVFYLNNCVYLDVPSISHEIVFNKLRIYKIGRNVEVVHEGDMFVNIKRSDNAAEPRLNGFARILSSEKHQDADLYKEYRQALLENLIPEFDDEIQPEKFYPLDFDMDKIAGCVNYKKGCYVGQEVTARTKYRGVKRKYLVVVDNLSDDRLFVNSNKVINKFDNKALLLTRDA